MRHHFLGLFIFTLLFSVIMSNPLINYAETKNNIDLEDGEYDVEFQLLTEEDKISEIKLNNENMAKIMMENQGNVVRISLDSEQVSGIEIQKDQRGTFEDDNFESLEIKKTPSEESENLRDVSFEVETLNEQLNAKIYIKEPEQEVDVHHVKFSFKTPEKIKDDSDDGEKESDNDQEDEIDDEKEPDNDEEDKIDDEKESDKIEEDEVDDEKESDKDNKVEDSKGSDDGKSEEPNKEDDLNNKKKDEKESSKKQKKAKGKYRNGSYKLPFKVLKEDEDDISTTEQYIKNPAKVIIKDDVYKVRMTITDSSWWRYLKVQSKKSGKYKDVRIIKEDKKKNTTLIEFTVEDIDEIMNAKVHLVIKEINYDHKYNIRFKFETSNLPLNPNYQEKDKRDSKKKKKTKNKIDKRETEIIDTNQGKSDEERRNERSSLNNQQAHSHSFSNENINSTNFLDLNKNNSVQSNGSTNQIDNLEPKAQNDGEKQSEPKAQNNSEKQSEPNAQNESEKQSEESKLHFDRDKDDFEAMPGDDDSDEVKEKGDQPSSSIAGLNKFQIALFSFLIVTSIIVLLIQLRKKIKAK